MRETEKAARGSPRAAFSAKGIFSEQGDHAAAVLLVDEAPDLLGLEGLGQGQDGLVILAALLDEIGRAHV